MKRQTGQAVLLGGGLAAALVAGAAVVWGRLRDVEAPRRGEWATSPAVCVVDADRQIVGEAIGILRDHGQDLHLLPESVECEPRDGWIVVRLDPTLDGETLPELSIDGPAPARGGGGHAWARTRVTQTVDGEIRRVDMRLHPAAQKTAAVHDLLHSLGWDHPPQAPSGHVLHPTRASLDDWRGVR